MFESGKQIKVTSSLRQVVENAEREEIERVLKEVGGNKARAAKILETSRGTVYRILKGMGNGCDAACSLKSKINRRIGKIAESIRIS